MNWRYRNTVLVLCTLAFFATMVARLAISPVVPDITAQFEVSNGAVGLALAGMWAAYATMQFPSGVLGDRFGERRVILAAVGLTAVGSLLLAVSPSFPTFALFTLALGAGAGLHYTVATTFISKQFSNIGRAIGVHVAGGPLAGLSVPVVAAVVAARYDWRASMLLGAIAAVPVFLLFQRRIEPTTPERPDQPMRERFAFASLFELLSRPEIVYTTILAVAGAFTWQATASFLPTFLVAYHDLSVATASALFSLYFVVHGATQPVMGYLSDRFDRDAAASLSMGLGVVGYATLIEGSTLPVFVVGACMVGVAMSWGAPIQSRFIDKLSAEERGAGFGLVRTAYMLLGATGSFVVGALSDAAGWAVAVGLLVGVMGVGFSVLAVNRVLKLGL
ncbi:MULTISPECIES: MFS transporter [Haloprofundus]|uniref:MFS transporter n=1 Tax=Haloprofundus TaxID=1911573 RepID=UPI000E44917B|nr:MULTISPECIES: MFS transporter [Haloprofundus]QCJ48013.1 MFS transporter [Haloprofundus sp. MHR1]